MSMVNNNRVAVAVSEYLHEQHPEWVTKTEGQWIVDPDVGELTAPVIELTVEVYPGNLIIVKSDTSTMSGFKTKFALAHADLEDAPSLILQDLELQIYQMVNGPFPFGFGIDHAREFDSWENEGGQ